MDDHRRRYTKRIGHEGTHVRRNGWDNHMGLSISARWRSPWANPSPPLFVSSLTAKYKDVIKTCIQTQAMPVNSLPSSAAEQVSLLNDRNTQIDGSRQERRKGAVEVARELYRRQGWRAFFRGLGVCSARAFVVNAVQVR